MKMDQIPSGAVLAAISRVGDLILPHIGYDFGGKRVLEIGATPNLNLRLLFPGARYELISLEDGQTHTGNFMDLEEDPYDVIVSIGVFEQFAIDRRVNSEGFAMGRYDNGTRLAKLAGLTLPGGYNAHASQGLEVLFSNEEIQQSGFELVSRQKRTMGYIQDGMRRSTDPTELVVMRRI